MIRMDKKYRTRDGREVRIYATDGGGMHPVHGSIKTSDGWRSFTWPSDGHITYDENCGDLIEVKPRIKRTAWLNVFPVNMAMYPDKEKADHYAGSARIACVKVEIDCEEGEGL